MRGNTLDVFYLCSLNIFSYTIYISKLLYFSLLQTTKLEEDEIVSLDENIEKISVLWQKYVSKTITAKFDALVMQVPQIVRNMDGYTGALSEQSIERLHNVVNQESRSVYHLADKAAEAKYLMKVYSLFIIINML